MKIYSDRVEFKGGTVYGSPAEISAKIIAQGYRETSRSQFKVTFLGAEIVCHLRLDVLNADEDGLELFRSVAELEFMAYELSNPDLANEFYDAFRRTVNSWLRRPAAILTAMWDVPC